MISRKKQAIFIFLILAFSLIGCANNDEENPLKNDIIGAWSANHDEDYNIYEFYDDGTGLLRASSEIFLEPVPFTYNFVENNKIEFSAQDDYSIFVEISMPTPTQLSWDADVTGGNHIEFEKVKECEPEELYDCILGSWMHYLPDGNVSVYAFRESFESSIFSVADEQSTVFAFEIIDGDTILYTEEDNDPINVATTIHNNYRMTLTFPEDEGGAITVYRLDN